MGERRAMKQRITFEQLNELTDEQKEQLREWWKPKVGDFYIWHSEGMKSEGEFLATDDVGPWADEEAGQYAIPVLSVGQMIDILHARNSGFGNHHIDFDWEGELCDALWDEVKQLL